MALFKVKSISRAYNGCRSAHVGLLSGRVKDEFIRIEHKVWIVNVHLFFKYVGLCVYVVGPYATVEYIFFTVELATGIEIGFLFFPVKKEQVGQQSRIVINEVYTVYGPGHSGISVVKQFTAFER